MLKLSGVLKIYLDANGYQLAESTCEGKQRAFKYLIEAVGNKMITTLDIDCCEAFKKYLVVNRCLAKTSANMMMRDVGSIFGWAVKVKELLKTNPFYSVKQFKVEQNRVNIYTAEQFTAMMQVASHIWQIRLLLGRSGLRRGEVLNLHKGNVREGYLYIEPKKTTDETWQWRAKDYECRIVPAPDRLGELLERQPCYYVALSERLYGNLLKMLRKGVLSARKKKCPDQNFNRDFRLIELAAFGKRIGYFHDLRRTFITTSLECGVPLHAVQATSGIAKTKTLMTHYSIVRQSSLDCVRETLNNSLKIRLPKDQPDQSAA